MSLVCQMPTMTCSCANVTISLLVCVWASSACVLSSLEAFMGDGFILIPWRVLMFPFVCLRGVC